MDELLDAITEALERKGISASAASEMAVGNPSVIKNLMNRRTKIDSQKDTVRNHPIENLLAVAEVLGLELYLGPPRNITEPSDGKNLGDFAFVKRFDVKLSAGPGANGDNARPLASVAFRKEWLSQQGLIADRCVVCGVTGDSMEPLLFDTDLVLIDRRVTELRNGQVYAVTDVAGDIRIKRLEKIEGGVLLHSDNPTSPTEVRMGDEADRIDIIGRLAWSGHTYENGKLPRPTIARGR